jgi:hypothetical protein
VTDKQKKLLTRLAEGRRLLPAQISDVASAQALINLGYAALEDDRAVKDRAQGGRPVQVLVITDEGRSALA